MAEFLESIYVMLKDEFVADVKLKEKQIDIRLIGGKTYTVSVEEKD